MVAKLIDSSETVPFDPGFSEHAVIFTPNIESAYNILNSIPALHQKKFQFKMFYPQLLRLVDSTIAFYLGCLLWASYISNKYKNSPKKIDGNSYLGKKVKPEDALHEIDFIISYLKQFEKDCRYYLGNAKDMKAEWGEIIQVYKDFLVLNDFLTKAETTADIKLPQALKPAGENELEKIMSVINDSISSAQLEKLYTVKNLIL